MIGHANVLSGKGKEYSEIADEQEVYFNAWLTQSGITLNEFVKDMRSGEVEITSSGTGSKASVCFLLGGQQYGLPLVYDESVIKYEEYLVETSLFLLYASNRAKDDQFNKHVENFIITHCSQR